MITQAEYFTYEKIFFTYDEIYDESFDSSFDFRIYSVDRTCWMPITHFYNVLFFVNPGTDSQIYMCGCEGYIKRCFLFLRNKKVVFSEVLKNVCFQIVFFESRIAVYDTVDGRE